VPPAEAVADYAYPRLVEKLAAMIERTAGR
jgi:hypothetical protein